jgi:hypothetical protein
MVPADESPPLYQGDIVVSKDELELLKQNITPYKNAITNSNYRWPRGQIYYMIDQRFSK